MTIYPGLIDSQTQTRTHRNLRREYGANDLVETSDEIMPHMHVWERPSTPSQALIPVARMERHHQRRWSLPRHPTRFPARTPSSNSPEPSAPECSFIRDNAMPLNFTGDERRNKGGFDKRKFPSTRMGLAAQLRQAFSTRKITNRSGPPTKPRKPTPRRTKTQKIKRRMARIKIKTEIKKKKRSPRPHPPSAT